MLSIALQRRKERCVQIFVEMLMRKREKQEKWILLQKFLR